MVHMHWRCAHGHEWNATLSSVRTGRWCPHCAVGRSERDVRNIFETIFVGYQFPTCRPAFLKGLRGRHLELDGYCGALHVAFEYNGEQHYSSNSFFHRRGFDRYADLVARDLLKTELCKAMGIRLVIVPYWVKDRWNYVRCCLMRWFRMSDLYPVAISQ